jgi:hypothetical protein
LRVKELAKEAQDIIDLLYLPQVWLSNIEDCLHTGKLTPQPNNAQILFKKNFTTGKTDLSIRIFKHTNLQDIKNAWPEVMKFQKHLIK